MRKIAIVIGVVGCLFFALFVLEARIDANHAAGLDPPPVDAPDEGVREQAVAEEDDGSVTDLASDAIPMDKGAWVVFSRTGTVHTLVTNNGVAKLEGSFSKMNKTSACIKEHFDVDGPVEIAGRWKNSLTALDRYANVSARFFDADGSMTSGQGVDRPVRLVVSAHEAKDWEEFVRLFPPPKDAAHVQLCIELKGLSGGVDVAGLTVRTGPRMLSELRAEAPAIQLSTSSIPSGDDLVVVAPSGTEGRVIDKRNRPRKGDDLVLYTPEHGIVSRQSEHGAEVAIEEGIVSAVRPYGSTKELPIPGNGYLLSGSGTAATYLKRFSVGDPVRLKKSGECLDQKHAVPVLVYHQLEHEGSSEVIEDHFRQMHETGYNTISLEQLDRWMEGVDNDLPDKPIVLTFDDGKKQHHGLLPGWMEKYDLKAVLFLIVTHLDHPFDRYLDWDDARAMVKSGRFELQCHSYDAHHKIADHEGVESGVYLAKEVEQTAEHHDLWKQRDLAACRNRLYAETGENSRYIAWPFGQYDNALIGAAARAGFEGMLTVSEGINGPGTSAHTMRRMTVSPDMQWEDVEARIGQWRVCPLMQTEMADFAPFSTYMDASSG